MPGEHGGVVSSTTSRTTTRQDPLSYSDKDYSYILGKIGAPVNPTNLGLMKSWRNAESGTHKNNPFNTTQPWQGASGSFVKHYQTRQQGLDATVDTQLNAGARKGGKGYYADVVRGFKGSNPDDTIRSIVQSPWAGGHYGGAEDWKQSSLYGAYYGKKSNTSTPASSERTSNFFSPLKTKNFWNANVSPTPDIGPGVSIFRAF